MAYRAAIRASWCCATAPCVADSFFFAYGTYTSGGGKWKGELTNQEHSPSFDQRPVWGRKVVTIGFSGTYTDETAYGEGMALAGKQSIRFKGNLRLLVPD